MGAANLAFANGVKLRIKDVLGWRGPFSPLVEEMQLHASAQEFEHCDSFVEENRTACPRRVFSCGVTGSRW
jgi:hypothetical protein